MTRKILKALLTLFLIISIGALCASAAEVASGTCGENLTWVFDDNDTLTIKGTGEIQSDSGMVWYSYRDAITSVVVENGVTSLGTSAFRNLYGLKRVTLPNSVKTIGVSSFQFCESLTDITIPNSVTSIENSAFYGCKSIVNITIPKSVANIGQIVFNDCESLENITVDENNMYFTNENGVLFTKNKKMLIRYPAGKIGDSYDIPKGVTTIDSQAFQKCNNLKRITVPESVRGIFVSVFSYCTSLESITVDSNNQFFLSENGVLFDKNKTNLIQYPAGKTDKVYMVPNSVTNMKGNAFQSCENLEEINLSRNTVIIEDSTFMDCKNLKSIEIPYGVTSIGRWVFMGCTSLESITIPNTVTSIGTNTFQECENLIIYGIPDSYAETYAKENGIPFEEMPSQPGDINGTGNADEKDLTNLADFIASNDISSLSEKQLVVANLYTADDGENGEPVINIKDLIALAQMLSQSQNA